MENKDDDLVLEIPAELLNTKYEYTEEEKKAREKNYEKKLEKLAAIFEKLKKDYEESNRNYVNIIKKMKKNELFLIGIIDNLTANDSIIEEKIKKGKEIFKENNIPCVEGENFFILDFRDFPAEFKLSIDGFERSHSPLVEYLIIKKIGDKPLDFYEHVDEIKQFMRIQANPKTGVNYQFQFLSF